MTEHDEFSAFARLHTLGEEPVPGVVLNIAGRRPIDLAWRNELGGLTFNLGDHFIKWNPRQSGIDLHLERERLEWLDGRHPAPSVVAYGADTEAQWMVTEALPGVCAVGDIWRKRRPEAIGALATGLRAIHSVPTDDFPRRWVGQSWTERTPPSLGPRPPVDSPVLVHGDACAPNTLISLAGQWIGHVDFGALGIGDRWADLAIASLSLDWNFGLGHQEEFFNAYGVEPDLKRIGYYRALWEMDS